VCRATLKESMRPVKDVEFAPRHLGLKLAAAAADGVVRLYEAVDVMNLSHWPQQVMCGRVVHMPCHASPGQPRPQGVGGACRQDVFEAEKVPGDVALSLSWNKSRFDPPSMAVAGNGVKVRRGAHSRVV
jgi:hypothetical protein